MATKQSIPKGWYRKFSKSKKVKIKEHNPELLQIVSDVKTKLRKILGKSVEIEHRGSSALGISGAGEVDLYLRVKNRKDFQAAFEKLKKEFGEPGSYYPDEPRARFNKIYKGVEFEQMLVLGSAYDEYTGRLFFNYIKGKPLLLKEYEAIKRKYAKVSKYKYQIEKSRFVRRILRLAKKEKQSV